MVIHQHVEEKGFSEDRMVDGAYMPKWRLRVLRNRNVRYITSLSQVKGLSEEERIKLKKVSDVYGFRTNSYYLSLVNWDDPDDPIRKLVIPDLRELDDTDSLLDACHEAEITVAPGLEHKYTTTALILGSRVCGAVCRFCFRKRIFMPDNFEIAPDLAPIMDYIRSHPEIDNVLITGGDPFILSTRKLEKIFSQLREIPHVKSIRCGTKLLAFNPFRFTDDPDLLDLLGEYSKPEARIYIVGHFNHPREITGVSVEAITRLLDKGVLLINQTPLLNGINDNSDILATLFTKLGQIGMPPYYVFQCRPTRGNVHFKVPLVKGIQIVEGAKKQVSGLGKRARYAGSHASGKILILGYDDKHMYFKYHQSRDPRYYGQFFKLPRKDDATWWDDWMPNGESFTLDTCPTVELGSGT